jgi:hypothetical protein
LYPCGNELFYISLLLLLLSCGGCVVHAAFQGSHGLAQFDRAGMLEVFIHMPLIVLEADVRATALEELFELWQHRCGKFAPGQYPMVGELEKYEHEYFRQCYGESKGGKF